MDKNGQRFPSALIPFCALGGDMSAMGTRMDQIEIPICSSFEPKVLNDQLCYEVDLSKFSVKKNIEKELKLGFNFIMDYNEDRQVTQSSSMIENELGLASSIVESSNKQHATIYINTIGKKIIKWLVTK